MAVCCQTFYDESHNASFIDEAGNTCFYSDEVPKSKFGLGGYGVARGCGSFGGKAGQDGHPVGRITRFGYEAYGVKRAGSFENKNPSPPAGGGEQFLIGGPDLTEHFVTGGRISAMNVSYTINPLSRRTV